MQSSHFGVSWNKIWKLPISVISKDNVKKHQHSANNFWISPNYFESVWLWFIDIKHAALCPTYATVVNWSELDRSLQPSVSDSQYTNDTSNHSLASLLKYGWNFEPCIFYFNLGFAFGSEYGWNRRGKPHIFVEKWLKFDKITRDTVRVSCLWTQVSGLGFEPTPDCLSSMPGVQCT